MRRKPPRTPLTELACDIHGVHFRIEASSTDLLEAAAWFFRAFPSSPWSSRRDDGGYLLRCQYGPMDPDALGEPVEEQWRGRLPTGLDGRVLSGPTVLVHELFGLASVCTSLRRRRADIRVLPGKKWALACGCITWPVCRFLAEEDQYVLHAACLWIGEGDGARAVLISGASGRGKTTTALALTRGGFRMASDDVTFVCDRPEGIAVWGLPRGCKVDENAFRVLPWLDQYDRHEALSDDRPEFFVAPEDQTAPELVRLRPPAAILFLQDRAADSHRLEPMPPVQAVSHLARENVRAVDARSRPQAARAFRAFGKLVRDCPAWSLSVGADIESLPDRVRPLVE